MRKKKYTIRIYRAHDLDIVSYIETYDINFTKLIYSVFKAYCNGEAFIVQPPQYTKQIDQKKVKRYYQRALILNDETDQREIEVMESIAPGYRNSFIKNLIRMYLRTPLTAPYLLNIEKDKEFQDSFMIFKKNIEQREVGVKAKNKKRRKKKNTEQTKIIKEKPVFKIETTESTDVEGPVSSFDSEVIPSPEEPLTSFDFDPMDAFEGIIDSPDQ